MLINIKSFFEFYIKFIFLLKIWGNTMLHKKVFLFIFAFVSSTIFSINCYAQTTEFYEEINKLTVTGYGVTKVLAEIAKVNLSVEVKEKQIEDVQKKLSTKSEKIIQTLKDNKANKINTEQLFISPNYNYKQPNVLIGHTGNMKISFEANTKEVGDIIAKAMSAGANKIDDIIIKPSDKVLEQARSSSLKLASKNAIDKANVVLEALELTQVSITQVKIHPDNSTPPPPRPYFAMAKANAPLLEQANNDFAPTIVAKEQEVQAQVTIKILYE